MEFEKWWNGEGRWMNDAGCPAYIIAGAAWHVASHEYDEIRMITEPLTPEKISEIKGKFNGLYAYRPPESMILVPLARYLLRLVGYEMVVKK
jgi:hypothetical protein